MKSAEIAWRNLETYEGNEASILELREWIREHLDNLDDPAAQTAPFRDAQITATIRPAEEELAYIDRSVLSWNGEEAEYILTVRPSSNLRLRDIADPMVLSQARGRRGRR